MESDTAKRYVVLDVEMCKVEGSRRRAEYRYKNEIIQIGAVMLDEDFREISTFSTFVRPRYGNIDWFIADLTGIHENQVKHAPELKEAMESMFGWMNGVDAEIFAWSNSDYNQFRHEVKAKGLEGADFEAFMDPNRWHDYQKIFGDRFDMCRHVGLKEAMDIFSLTQEGRAHDGLVDAHNTGRLIALLEQNPELPLPEVYATAHSVVTENLSFSLGGLLSGLNLEELPA